MIIDKNSNWIKIGLSSYNKSLLQKMTVDEFKSKFDKHLKLCELNSLIQQLGLQKTDSKPQKRKTKSTIE